MPPTGGQPQPQPYPQPYGAPQPYGVAPPGGAFGPPPPFGPPPKKRGALPWVLSGLGVAVVVVLVGGLVWPGWFTSSESGVDSPDTLAAAFADAVNNRDPDALVALVCDQSHTPGPAERAQEKQKWISSDARVTQQGAPQRTGDTATVVMREAATVDGRTQTIDETVAMRQSGGHWCITSGGGTTSGDAPPVTGGGAPPVTGTSAPADGGSDNTPEVDFALDYEIDLHQGMSAAEPYFCADADPSVAQQTTALVTAGGTIAVHSVGAFEQKYEKPGYTLVPFEGAITKGGPNKQFAMYVAHAPSKADRRLCIHEIAQLPDA